MKRALLVSLLALGCGPSAEGYPFVRTDHCPPDCDAGPSDAGTDARIDAGPPTIPPEPIEDWDTTGAGPLSGIFALEVIVEATVVVDVETRQLYRVRALQTGTNVRLHVTPCLIDLVTVPGLADLRLSSGARDAVRRISIDLEGDFLSSPDPVGAVFEPPPAFVVIGASLSSPESDPLPTMADPSTARDDDGDGFPGITVDADAVVCDGPEQAYAALRASLALSGTIADLDAFDGEATPVLEPAILGYSERCLSVATTLSVTVRPGSVFHARRLGDEQDLDANGNVSCPEIEWWSPRFFGAYWLR